MSTNSFSLFYIEEIKRNCQMIQERISAHAITHDTYSLSTEYQDLLTLPMLRICELIKTYRAELETLNPSFEWKDIAAMRDKIAHPYGGFDFEFVWEASQQDLSTLINACDEILQRQFYCTKCNAEE